jgi:hypothetical protein
VTCTEVRELAFQLAEKNGIEHRFSHEKKMAGWDWVVGFKNRNSDLPEETRGYFSGLCHGF